MPNETQTNSTIHQHTHSMYYVGKDGGNTETTDPDTPYRNTAYERLIQSGPEITEAVLKEIYYCPISETLFLDPVITRDGRTFERAAIERLIEDKQLIEAYKHLIKDLEHRELKKTSDKIPFLKKRLCHLKNITKCIEDLFAGKIDLLKDKLGGEVPDKEALRPNCFMKLKTDILINSFDILKSRQRGIPPRRMKSFSAPNVSLVENQCGKAFLVNTLGSCAVIGHVALVLEALVGNQYVLTKAEIYPPAGGAFKFFKNIYVNEVRAYYMDPNECASKRAEIFRGNPRICFDITIRQYNAMRENIFAQQKNLVKSYIRTIEKARELLRERNLLDHWHKCMQLADELRTATYEKIQGFMEGISEEIFYVLHELDRKGQLDKKYPRYAILGTYGQNYHNCVTWAADVLKSNDVTYAPPPGLYLPGGRSYLRQLYNKLSAPCEITEMAHTHSIAAGLTTKNLSYLVWGRPPPFITRQVNLFYIQSPRELTWGEVMTFEQEYISIQQKNPVDSYKITSTNSRHHTKTYMRKVMEQFMCGGRMSDSIAYGSMYYRESSMSIIMNTCRERMQGIASLCHSGDCNGEGAFNCSMR